ncbi:hypothetical protein [Gloeothece verrucosa]|uniref:Uncharacterized protein n=1 Tax=Gloeothece verrucosa (strain PCC 7822) TaxID=497965 RepID=E0UMA2_GLOV7|nr:hypothetical protein [Gloeothece verrucosa]ADN18082.1 hypothetical protein Cyan7822_6282 [Gloeothece verrucosa PCC 7822]
MYLLANTFGYEQSTGLLNVSDSVMKANAQSWDSLWNDAVSTNSGLWQGLIQIGTLLAAIGIVYSVVKFKQDLLRGNGEYDWSKIIEFIVPVLFVAVFTVGNGNLLAYSVKMTRTVVYYEIGQLYDVQINGLNIKTAIEAIQNSQFSNTKVKELFAECKSYQGEELQKCITDPDRLTALEELANGNKNTLNGNLANLICNMTICSVVSGGASILDGIKEGLNPNQIMTNLFSSQFISIAQGILTALQWAVSNGLELALLFTGLLAPVALGLSLFPLAGNFFWVWLSGFFAIIGTNLGYAILTGLMAITIYSISSINGNSGIPELLSDIGFLLFASIVSPLIAASAATFGGISLYNGISRAASDAMSAATNTVVSVARIFVV